LVNKKLFVVSTQLLVSYYLILRSYKIAADYCYYLLYFIGHSHMTFSFYTHSHCSLFDCM